MSDIVVDLTKPIEIRIAEGSWTDVCYGGPHPYEKGLWLLTDPTTGYTYNSKLTNPDWVRNKLEPATNEHSEPKVNAVSPLGEQVGGSHYKGFAIQPIEFIHKNNLGFIEGNIIKYICREEIVARQSAASGTSKGGKEDLLKVIHYARMLLELKYDTVSQFSVTSA